MKKSTLAIDPEVLRGAAGKAVAALKLLANEDRLLLLCQAGQMLDVFPYEESQRFRHEGHATHF